MHGPTLDNINSFPSEWPDQECVMLSSSSILVADDEPCSIIN